MHPDSKTRAVRRFLHSGFVVVAVLIGIAGFDSTAYAQNIARVNIDFAFVFAGKDMPAGGYEFEATSGRVLLRSQSGKAAAVAMPVITRLGRHDADTDPELVFDKVDGKFSLSEFWPPNSDGYLLLNTPADHEHRVLGGSRPHK